MDAFPDLPKEWRSYGEQVIDRLIDAGVTFPEGKPTRWHYRVAGDTPRTCIVYEERVSHGAEQYPTAKCSYKGFAYNEVWTFLKIKYLARNDFYINTSDQFILYIGGNEGSKNAKFY